MRSKLSIIDSNENVKQKKSDSAIDIKNIFFGVFVFVLSSIIILLTYSIYQKLINPKIPKYSQEGDEKISEIIQVEVLNGCGVSGVADRFTEYLRANGCDVVSSSNYYQFDVQKTIVIDRIGNRANARHVADLLGVKNVVTQKNEEYFLDVSIIIGNDYKKLKAVK